MKKIYYGKAVYNSKEIDAVNKVLKNNSLSLVDGANVKILENKVCKIFGKKYGLMVNSGSSANLLALASFNFKKDSEIILVCGAGGQAVLTGKTLVDMGYSNVSNVGAISDWKDKGGPMSK